MSIQTTVATPEFPDKVWVAVNVTSRDSYILFRFAISFPYGLITDPLQMAQDVCEKQEGLRIKDDKRGNVTFIPWANVSHVTYEMVPQDADKNPQGDSND